MDDNMNMVLSVVIHVFIGSFLVLYMPISLLIKLVQRLFIRPFEKEADLKGKIVLITGASSGIGEQLAYQYAKRGACMALVARREDALKAVAKASLSLGAPDVITLVADISDPEESKRVVDQTVAHFGKLDHLLANAGIWGTCLFEEITNITAFTKMMDVNFWGAVYPTYYALPHLKASKGNIIVTTSVAGRVPTARMSFYNASKAAMIRFYETLRSEVGSQIKITILMPGYVVSELTKGKALQKGGQVEINEDARDIQVGLFPVGQTEKLAQIAIDSACRGEEYVTWPDWYKPFHLLMSLAPEVLNWYSNTFYMTQSDEKQSILIKRILEATGAKRYLYPNSILSAKKE
ncbi:11-beta-hydroxysteroid dehydrogenase 1B [Rhynchospora pubera]|uniref:11-beta-hydroxysteroid dehydrogenase 1B n=1 Tax=Rhynchospora pubera TaxID=906938 RepID=A0AAV8HTQ9_9POAL|nr:11-beta-hydroxysteroid dehydrogenase 1B [Rhynchospora pubera]